MNTKQRDIEATNRAYGKHERDARIQAAEVTGIRNGMTLMERLEWYGADLEVAMEWNDPVLFANARNHCRPEGK